MAQITAALVKQLREMTDSPMMECKKALVEADGDIEKAVDVLRKMGMAKAVKKAGRETNEGTIAAYVSEDGKTAALAEVTCETDFVGTNPKFTGFAKNVAAVVAKANPADVESLKAAEFSEGETVESAFTEMIHVMGENMKISRFERLAADNGAFGTYVHANGKVGTVVEFSFSKPETAEAEAFKTFAHDCAMQAAAIPGTISARREDVPADVVEHEMSIYKAQAAESGKPEPIQQKIAEGRLNKFFAESVLSEQAFIKDGDITIRQYAEKVSKELGDKIEVVAFKRLTFGE